MPGAPAEPGEPEPFVPHGSIDVGFGFSALNAGYQNWNGQFVRGVLVGGCDNVQRMLAGGELQRMLAAGEAATAR